MPDCCPSVRRAAEAAPQDASLVDISLQGAMIKTNSALATVGDTVTLGIAVTFDNAPVQLNLSATICHNNRGANDASYYIGLAFKNLTQHDKLVLHYATQSPQLAAQTT